MTGVSSSCGACKFLRRRCSEECIFAPYFCYEQAATHFAAVHKVFGASNVSKLLSHLPVHTRSDAAITVSYEALARMQDPIYGCVSHIFALQQQVACLAEEIEIIEKQMADVGINVIPCESSNPYFPIEVDMRSNVISMNEEWCSHMELQYPDEILEGYLNSSLIDRLVEDYYVHEQLSLQDYNQLQPLWMKYAAADQY